MDEDSKELEERESHVVRCRKCGVTTTIDVNPEVFLEETEYGGWEFVPNQGWYCTDCSLTRTRW